MKTSSTRCYKIIEPSRALSLVDRCVSLRVRKHGCDVLDSRAFLRIILYSEGWENSRDVVEGLHNCLEFSQTSSCLDEAIFLSFFHMLYLYTQIRLGCLH